MPIFKSKIPTLCEALPELGEAINVRERIQAECNDAKIKAAELRSEMSRGVIRDPRDPIVAAILAGEKPPEPVGDAKRLGELLRRIEDLNVALDAQRSKINRLESRASVAICERLRPEHDKLAGAVCAKLLELYDLNVKYTELLDGIADAGASTGSLPILQSLLLEHPKYRDSAIGYSFRDAAKQGHMSVKQIPEPLR
jgi:hypothetical protein